MENLDQKIIDAYKKYNYVGKSKLHKILQSENVLATMKDVDRVIDGFESYQLHKKQKKGIEGHMVAFFVNQIQLIDLLDLQNYKSQNDQYKYILTIIDVFTRKAFCYPMKTKNAETVLELFKQHIQKNKPQMLVSDNGSEFTNNAFQKLLKDESIFHNTNEPGYHNTLGVIDSFSRYFKEKMHRYFTDNNTTKWIDKLDSFVKSYNETPHSSLQNVTPNNATRHQTEIRQINFKKNKTDTHNFKTGDVVRKRLKKARFDKGYKIIWTTHVFTIDKVSGVNALLTNGENVKLNDLQIVVPTSQTKDVSEIEKANKENKDEKAIQKTGVELANVVEGKRVKKMTQKMAEYKGVDNTKPT